MSPETPNFVTKLFWEYAHDAINIVQHKQFIIERILEKGCFKSVKWLFKTYSPQEVLGVLQSTNISSSTRNLWSSYFATIA